MRFVPEIEVTNIAYRSISILVKCCIFENIHSFIVSEHGDRRVIIFFGADSVILLLSSTWPTLSVDERRRCYDKTAWTHACLLYGWQLPNCVHTCWHMCNEFRWINFRRYDNNSALPAVYARVSANRLRGDKVSERFSPGTMTLYNNAVSTVSRSITYTYAYP